MHLPQKITTHVARTTLVSIGAFDCRLGNRELGPEQATLAHSINVHRVGTYTKHVEGARLQVVPGSIVFFQRGQAYRTSHPHGCGDSGRWISLRQDWLAEICAESNPSALEHPDRPFPVHALPPDPRISLAIEWIAARAGDAEPIELEEAGAAFIRELARRAAGAPRGAMRPNRARRELAEALRERLARDLGGRSDLPSLARELGASPFALCRAFKTETGLTMSAWRRRARLQCALQRVLGSREELLPLAIELGFASHSHLTREFRVEFGIAPSKLRAQLRTRARLALEVAERLGRAAS